MKWIWAFLVLGLVSVRAGVPEAPVHAASRRAEGTAGNNRTGSHAERPEAWNRAPA